VIVNMHGRTTIKIRFAIYGDCIKKDEIFCCCEALARQCCNVFGKQIAEPKDISTASVRDLCLFIRGIGLLNLC
jgi:hypothetical protein